MIRTLLYVSFVVVLFEKSITRKNNAPFEKYGLFFKVNFPSKSIFFLQKNFSPTVSPLTCMLRRNSVSPFFNLDNFVKRKIKKWKYFFLFEFSVILQKFFKNIFVFYSLQKCVRQIVNGDCEGKMGKMQFLPKHMKCAFLCFLFKPFASYTSWVKNPGKGVRVRKNLGLEG